MFFSIFFKDGSRVMEFSQIKLSFASYRDFFIYFGYRFTSFGEKLRYRGPPSILDTIFVVIVFWIYFTIIKLSYTTTTVCCGKGTIMKFGRSSMDSKKVSGTESHLLLFK